MRVHITRIVSCDFTILNNDFLRKKEKEGYIPSFNANVSVRFIWFRWFLIFTYDSKGAIAAEIFIHRLYEHTMLVGRKVSRSLLYCNTTEAIGSGNNDGVASSFPSFLPSLYRSFTKHGSRKVFTACKARFARLVSKYSGVACSSIQLEFALSSILPDVTSNFTSRICHNVEPFTKIANNTV